MVLTSAGLETMRNVDIRTVDRSSLVDINDVRTNENLPQLEKLFNHIKQIKNPYCYKCGDIIIKESFSDNGKTMNDCFEQFVGALV